MKLYAICTPTHAVLKDDWFLPTLKDDYELVVEYVDQDGIGEFMQDGWVRTVSKKVELVLRAIGDNRDHWFVFSDVDIQFFDKTWPAIEPLTHKCDIVIQNNSPSGEYCTGFFACRANDRTNSFFQAVRDRISLQKRYGDQGAFNKLLDENKSSRPRYPLILRALAVHLKKRHGLYFLGHWLDDVCSRRQKNAFGVCVGYLPPTFMGGGNMTGRNWKPGKELFVPPGIIMHHANWCVGIEEKIKQLSYVREKWKKLW